MVLITEIRFKSKARCGISKYPPPGSAFFNLMPAHYSAQALAQNQPQLPSCPLFQKIKCLSNLAAHKAFLSLSLAWLHRGHPMVTSEEPVLLLPAFHLLESVCAGQ